MTLLFTPNLIGIYNDNMKVDQIPTVYLCEIMYLDI